MNSLQKKREYNKKWLIDHPDYHKKWRDAHPDYNRKKVNKYYQVNKQKLLDYYKKKNANSETKLLVRKNIDALAAMSLTELFFFQALHMKNSTPVSIGAFFIAIKDELANANGK
jgi:hypothetical protein